MFTSILVGQTLLQLWSMSLNSNGRHCRWSWIIQNYLMVSVWNHFVNPFWQQNVANEFTIF
jgi:hypothetical protein